MLTDPTSDTAASSDNAVTGSLKMRRYTPAAIDNIHCYTPTTTDVSTSTNIIQLPGTRSALAALPRNLNAPDLNANAQAGMGNWFSALDNAGMNTMLRAIMSFPAIVALADGERGQWRDTVFALAHANHLGATEARSIALAWSKTSNKFVDEDFSRDWNSFDPNRNGGITLATLLHIAKQAGFDLSPWRNAGTANATTVGASGFATTVGANNAAAFSPAVNQPFFSSVLTGAANLFPVQWLVPGLLQRGEVTVIAGQGGGAKTACAISLAVALASGRQSIGPFRINTRAEGLRVAIVSAEEDPGRIGLLVAAACNVPRLTAAERNLVATNLLVHDAQASGWRIGEPAPGSREQIAPEALDRGLVALRTALAQFKPDVLILDTLAALFAIPSENDNNLMTALMRRVGRVAREVCCAVLLLHHTPKQTREAIAAQRGEATLVRGGGAIANSARVVLSITALPAAEAGQFVVMGMKPDAVRRLEHVKVNDLPPMEPAHFRITSEKVQVCDGTDHAVRAVEFITPPSAGGINNALRNVAMKTIERGALDEHGAKVPLSPGGGRNNARDGVHHIARELMNAHQGLAETHAQTAARDVLKDLQRIGCVAEQTVRVPRYKTSGQPDGTREARGLVCRWDLAPWAALPSPPDADPTVVRDAPGEPSGEAVAGGPTQKELEAHA